MKYEKEIWTYKYNESMSEEKNMFIYHAVCPLCNQKSEVTQKSMEGDWEVKVVVHDECGGHFPMKRNEVLVTRNYVTEW